MQTFSDEVGTVNLPRKVGRPRGSQSWQSLTQEVNQYIGARIRDRRKHKKWTIEDLAAAIHTTKQSVGQYERGEIAVNVSQIRIIAIALDSTVAHLVGDDELIPEYDQSAIDIIRTVSQMSPELRTAARDVISAIAAANDLDIESKKDAPWQV